MRTCNAAVALTLTILAGCGGGGSTSPVPKSVQSPGRSAHTAAVMLRLKIPAPNSSTSFHLRRPRYVSPSTVGIGVVYRASAVAGQPAFAFPDSTAPLVTLDVSAQSSACSAQVDGSRACSLAFAVAPGTDDFQITAWDAQAAGGSFAGARRLATATILNQTIGPASATALNFTLDGIVNAISLAVTPRRLTASDVGTVQNATLAVNAQDVDGNIILGSGAFIDANGAPLAITVAAAATGPGSALRTTLASTSITPQSPTVAVTYLGGASSGTQFNATTNGSIAGGIRGTTLSIEPRAVVTEFALAGGVYPTGITVGPNGSLWFAQNTTQSVGMISTSGTFGSSVPSGGMTQSPGSITAGPDGNIWVGVDSARAIDRITPAGSVTAFTSGLSGDPFAITAGPDGNLWFTESFHDRIGRISPSGAVTEFASGISAGAFPYVITAGPDGNLWFTEFAGSVARITPAGVVTEFSNGISPGAFITGISAGPDGGLWFCEYSPGQIGRIDPVSGAIAEFPVGAGGTPREITTGPDGALWFTLYTSDEIGRMDTSGNVSFYSTGITAGALPNDLVTGPDGNLWFTEAGGSRIGRFEF